MACTIKLFYPSFFAVSYKARVFATDIHLRISLIFVGQSSEPTIKVESCKWLHSGKLQTCLQLLDLFPVS